MDKKFQAVDPIFVLRTTSGVTCVRYGGSVVEEKVLFSGSTDGTINIWSIKQNRIIKVIKSHSRNTILDVVQLKDGTLLSHGRDGKIIHWRFEENNETIKDCIEVYSLGFCPISVLQNGNTNWIGFQTSADSEVKVLCLENKAVICNLEPKEKLGMVMQIKLFEEAGNDRAFALIGYEDGSVALWDINQSEMAAKLKLHNDPVMCLDIDSQHSKAASGSADDKLVQFSIDIKSGCFMQELRTIQLKSKGLSSIKVRPDCKIVAVGCWDGRIRVFGWKKLKPLAILQYHSETINSIDFSNDNILACACKDCRISLWDVYSKV